MSFRIVSVWVWIVPQSKSGGEMVGNVIRNGTMLAVSMMVVIAARNQIARNVKMRWLN